MLKLIYADAAVGKPLWRRNLNVLKPAAQKHSDFKAPNVLNVMLLPVL